MKSTVRIVLVAFAAGVLGIAASLWSTGPGPLLGPMLRSEVGQRTLQGLASASAWCTAGSGKVYFSISLQLTHQSA